MVINTSNGAIITVTTAGSDTDGNLTIDGALRFQAATTYDGTLTNNSNFCSDADFTVSGTLINNGNVCFEAALTVTGTLTNNGTINANTFDCSGGTCTGNAVGSEACECVQFLPVELSLFAGQAAEKWVALTWATASETNNQGFEIQRAAPKTGESELSWEKIGFVLGQATSTIEQRYEFLDRNARPGINYYRLKQLDFDGQYSYSGMISVSWENEREGEQSPVYYPNPTTGDLMLYYASAQTDDKAQLSLYDLNGRVVFQQPLQLTAGYNSLPVQLPSLPAGMYIVQLRSASELWQQQLIVE